MGLEFKFLFTKNPNQKSNKKFIFWGLRAGGMGGGLGISELVFFFFCFEPNFFFAMNPNFFFLGGGGARVSGFFLTKDPNLNKKSWGGGGQGWAVETTPGFNQWF